MSREACHYGVGLQFLSGVVNVCYGDSLGGMLINRKPSHVRTVIRDAALRARALTTVLFSGVLQVLVPPKEFFESEGIIN